jgi:hypothetical protein
MKPKTRTIEIGGEKWKVIFKKPQVADNSAIGFCVYEDNKIYVTPDSDCLGTYIHEILHALFPQINEASIVEAEHVLMDALSKFPEEYLNKETSDTFEL